MSKFVGMCSGKLQEHSHVFAILVDFNCNGCASLTVKHYKKPVNVIQCYDQSHPHSH